MIGLLSKRLIQLIKTCRNNLLVLSHYQMQSFLSLISLPAYGYLLESKCSRNKKMVGYGLIQTHRICMLTKELMTRVFNSQTTGAYTFHQCTGFIQLSHLLDMEISKVQPMTSTFFKLSLNLLEWVSLVISPVHCNRL